MAQTKVIAQYPEVVVLEDDNGRFLLQKDSDEIVNIPDLESLPIINVHVNLPNALVGSDLHREVTLMLT